MCPETQDGTVSTYPVVSVVIPARNEGARITRCLQALDRQTLDRRKFEVIVVDDGSDDDTVDVSARQGARVVRQRKSGAAAARNRGIDEARAEIVLFIDADCVPNEHWAERLSNPLMTGSVQGTVGRIVSQQLDWVAAWIQVELDERYSRMVQHESIDFLSSGNCGFKREILCENHFDESFHWAEDLELSFRLAQTGNRMTFVPDAVVEHPHPERLLVYLRRKFHYASFAPYIYSLYPNKIFSDSRTPVHLRWQVSLATLSLVALLGTIISSASLLFSLICLGGWFALSTPIVRRAFYKSTALGMVAPFLVFVGNLAFAAGIACGIMARTGFRSHRSSSRM